MAVVPNVEFCSTQIGLRNTHKIHAMNKIHFYNADKVPFRFKIAIQGRDKRNFGVPNIRSRKITLPKNTVFPLKTGNNIINIDKMRGKIIFSILKE